MTMIGNGQVDDRVARRGRFMSPYTASGSPYLPCSAETIELTRIGRAAVATSARDEVGSRYLVALFYGEC